MLVHSQAHFEYLSIILPILSHIIGPLGCTLPIQENNTLIITKRGRHIIQHLLKENRIMNSILKKVYELPYGVTFVVYAVGHIMKKSIGNKTLILKEIMSVYEELSLFEKHLEQYVRAI